MLRVSLRHAVGWRAVGVDDHGTTGGLGLLRHYLAVKGLALADVLTSSGPTGAGYAGVLAVQRRPAAVLAAGGPVLIRDLLLLWLAAGRPVDAGANPCGRGSLL